MKIYEGAIKAQPSEVKSYIALAKLQAESATELDALLPAVLAKAFTGEL